MEEASLTTELHGRPRYEGADQHEGGVESLVAPPGLSYHPHPLLLRFTALADALVQALGPNYEVVLHDLRHPDHSLCHLAGNVTGRSVGAPATNVLLEAMEAQGDAAEDIFNYPTELSGRPLRSSIIFVRDGKHVVGAFCLNVDVSGLEMLREEIDRLIGFGRKEAQRDEVFRNSVSDLVDDLLTETFSEAGLRPSDMSPDDRMRVVASLQARGAFHAKGAVERVAHELGVSKFTIYGYLQRLRRSRRQGALKAGKPQPG
jgi:predicted transcriptional regulator YheO